MRSLPTGGAGAMTESRATGYVLCVVGCRSINKRMAMFIEGVLAEGLAVRIVSLPRGCWILDKSENPTIPSRIGRLTVDIGEVSGTRLASVMCFHWSMLPAALGYGLLRQVPVIYDEHDHYELNTLEGGGSAVKRAVYSHLVRWIHRIFLPFVSLVTCIHLHQQTLKKHLAQWQSRVIEVHNYPARIWRQSQSVHDSATKLCFVYIGGVYYEKGVGASAEAFQLLPDQARQNAELHVFGEGDAALIRELRTMPGVVVHNAVTPAEFRGFAAAHRCCGLSLLANTPRYRLVGTNCTKLYEYLALGMPVIATRVGEFTQFVGGYQLGLLIDGDLSHRQLTREMLRLLEDNSLFDRFSANARELMRSDEMTWEYEWDRIYGTGVVGNSRKAA